MGNTKTWLDGLQGWDPDGSVIDTYWVGDPAIDQDKSDHERYFTNLEKDALCIRPGCKPGMLRITLPSGPSMMEIRTRLVMSQEAAAAAAFELCVTFPDNDEIARVNHGGAWRLPQPILMALIANRELAGADMIKIIGMWIIGKCLLTDEEKKTSLLDSTRKTSGSKGPTAVKDATKGANGSKGARTRRRKGKG